MYRLCGLLRAVAAGWRGPDLSLRRARLALALALVSFVSTVRASKVTNVMVSYSEYIYIYMYIHITLCAYLSLYIYIYFYSITYFKCISK